jgi:beta-phosphoglucomutase-like phosphatase (HAD superfamily)
VDESLIRSICATGMTVLIYTTPHDRDQLRCIVRSPRWGGKDCALKDLRQTLCDFPCDQHGLERALHMVRA